MITKTPPRLKRYFCALYGDFVLEYPTISHGRTPVAQNIIELLTEQDDYRTKIRAYKKHIWGAEKVRV